MSEKEFSFEQLRYKTLIMEWEATHDEYLELVRQRFNLLTVVTGVLGILYAIGMSEFGRGLIGLLPFVALAIILPAARMTATLSEYAYLQFAYLERFVEPQLGMLRERRFATYWRSPRRPGGYGQAFTWIYVALLLISIFLPLMYLAIAKLPASQRQRIDSWLSNIPLLFILVLVIAVPLFLILRRMATITMGLDEVRSAWAEVEHLTEAEAQPLGGMPPKTE